MKGFWMSLAALVAVALLGAYVLTRPVSARHAYLINQEVFDGFQGKVMLEKQLEEIRRRHRQALDSVESTSDLRQEQALRVYEQLQQYYGEQEQDLTRRYTADIWREINRLVEQFGKEQGYAFIYGAAGNGSLMMGDPSYNVTTEVIEYCNKHYEGN